jgi:hypothetical protein
MCHAFACLITMLMILAGSLVTAEPSVGVNGWSNVPGVLEGTITTRPVDMTSPRPPLGYLEYLPLGYDPGDTTTRWPLVVFISGLGELGDGTDTVANGHQLRVNMVRHGPFRQMTKANWDFPAILVAVQSPGYWNNATILNPVFAYLISRYRVDTSRLYLTGLCDGAVGVFNFASQNPGFLAGIIPIEVGSDPNPGMAAILVQQPMWAVHSFNDVDIARTSSILWVDQAALAVDAAAAGVMSTYPVYPGNPNHMAVDSDPATGRPLNPFGPTMPIRASRVTAGSSEIVFGSARFGSAMFNSWAGTDALPYALVHPGEPPDRGAKAGVMFRDSLAPGATHVMVAQGANNEVFLNWRSTTGAASGSGARSGGSSVVKWVRLARSGTTFTGSYSLDGVEWISLGSRTVAITGSSCLGGVAITAHDDATTYTQAITHLSLGAGLIGADIGSPGRAGSTGFANATWTVVGGGSDIGNSVDQFHYAHTTVAGDETITARIGTDVAPMVIALGKPDRLYLTRPYPGPTAVQDLYIQLPVGYNTTAYYDAGAHAWDWQRNQNWDRTRSGRHIFTMSWSKNHVQGWADTYANGDCWDWLFSQSLPVAPVIISTQPLSLSVPDGQVATFSAEATGSGPMTWQWLRNDLAIGGASGSTYTTPVNTMAESGCRYSVTVSNAAGAVTSATAVLTVAAVAPVITSQPEDAAVGLGRSAQFAITAIGTPMLEMQWQRAVQPDGVWVDLAGAVASSYRTAAMAADEHEAEFRCRVRNRAGEVVSEPATLTVGTPPPAGSGDSSDGGGGCGAGTAAAGILAALALFGLRLRIRRVFSRVSTPITPNGTIS